MPKLRMHRIVALGGVGATFLSATAYASEARCPKIALSGGTLSSLLRSYARAAGIQIIFDERTVAPFTRDALTVKNCPEPDLELLLQGTNLELRNASGRIFVIIRRQGEPGAVPTHGEAPPQEIVVTARRRVEPAIMVPIALTSFGGQATEDSGVDNVADAIAAVPGVGSYDLGNGMTKITIRGVSTSLGSNENGYYLDDLPFTGVTVPISPDVRAWDLERVEILRGPQGTLFGEGSMGGTVRILTNSADPSRWEARASATTSVTGDGGANHGVKLMLNAPMIKDRLAVRISGTRERFSGWLDDPTTGRSNVNAQRFDTLRAKLRFDPTESLSVSGAYWLYNSNFPSGSSQGNDDGSSSRSLSIASAVRYRLYGTTARYRLDSAELFYGYSHNIFEWPQSGTFVGSDLSSTIRIRVDAHELRLASSGNGPLQWTVGAYVRSARRSDDVRFSDFDIDNVDVTRSSAKALFGELGYKLGEFDLTGGFRLYEERLTGFEINSGVIRHDQGGLFRKVNPRLSLAWHPGDRSTLYISAAKGFRAAQLQPSTAIALAGACGIELTETLQPDSIWTIEAGGKAEVAGSALTLEGAIYSSRWKGVAVRVPIADTGFNGLIPSQGTLTQGTEFSATFRPSRSLRLSANLSYVDARYRGNVENTGIVKGAPVDDVARFTASASADYRRRLGRGLTATARISWQHSSPRRFVSFPGYLPGDIIDRVDARVGLEFPGIDFAFFVDNLADERGATSYRTVQPVPGKASDVVAFRLRPRTVGFTVRFALAR